MVTGEKIGIEKEKKAVIKKLYELNISIEQIAKAVELNEEDVKIEAHILDFDRNIYGKDIEIRFVKKLRGMIKFDNLFDLTQQVLDDTKTVARLHKGNETETR